MDKISKERRHQRAIQAAIDAQIALEKMQAEVDELRARFKQWCREAEMGLRMLLDNRPPLAPA